MLRDSYQWPIRLRQVKRDPAVFCKYLDGSLHLLLQWMRRLTLQLSILLLFLMTEPGHSQQIQATVWKLTNDLIWKLTRQIHQIILQLLPHRPHSKNLGHCLENDTGSQLEDADTAMSSTMVRNSNTQNPPVLIRPYRKVHTYHDERMNRLL
jgi:hypothetical protein